MLRDLLIMSDFSHDLHDALDPRRNDRASLKPNFGFH
jgi:hypothetical protein